MRCIAVLVVEFACVCGVHTIILVQRGRVKKRDVVITVHVEEMPQN